MMFWILNWVSTGRQSSEVLIMSRQLLQVLDRSFLFNANDFEISWKDMSCPEVFYMALPHYCISFTLLYLPSLICVLRNGVMSKCKISDFSLLSFVFLKLKADKCMMVCVFQSLTSISFLLSGASGCPKGWVGGCNENTVPWCCRKH